MKKKQTKPLSKTGTKKLVAKLTRKATKIFNKYIREKAKLNNPVCPICKINPVQVCFHIVSAKRKSTRFDERNVLGACVPCNYQENYWSDVSRAYYIRTFGTEQYLSVVDKSKEDLVYTPEYLQNVIDTYQHKLANLPVSSK